MDYFMGSNHAQQLELQRTIYVIMRKEKLSAADLARLLGLSHPTIMAFLRNQKLVRALTLCKIQDFVEQYENKS